MSTQAGNSTVVRGEIEPFVQGSPQRETCPFVDIQLACFTAGLIHVYDVFEVQGRHFVEVLMPQI